jgi:hypothetical protein
MNPLITGFWKYLKAVGRYYFLGQKDAKMRLTPEELEELSAAFADAGLRDHVIWLQTGASARFAKNNLPETFEQLRERAHKEWEA